MSKTIDEKMKNYGLICKNVFNISSRPNNHSHLSIFFVDHLKFENVTILTNINVDNLNGIDMKTIIPLHTDQVIDGTLNLGFVSVDKDLYVGKLINGHNLTEEYENTVLVSNKI